MKIVTFKKDHVAGYKEGQTRELKTKLADRLKKEGYVKAGTEKDLEASLKELSETKKLSAYEKMKAEVNASKSECEGCGGKKDEDGNCEGCDDEIKYHVLTDEDIDAHGDAADGLEVGDEVEINDKDELLIGEDGKLIKKPGDSPEGNV